MQKPSGLHGLRRASAIRPSPRVVDGRLYRAQLTFGDRRSPELEFDYRDVAELRGNLDWCRELAGRVRQLAREHLLTPLAAQPTSGAR